MIHIGICDDERIMRDQLSALVSEYMKNRGLVSYKISCFTDGLALLGSGFAFDLIFLDIRMEQKDGLETARMLRERGDGSFLIFVTILKECVFDAFEVDASDYLLKPVTAHRLWRTMDRVMKNLEYRSGKSILIQKGNAFRMIRLSELVYGEVLGRKLYLHQADQSVIDYYDKLERLEQKVDQRFFRCHRSYLVNLDYVRGCKGGWVILPGDIKIPVSRLREKELTQALLRHMKERVSGCDSPSGAITHISDR